MNATKFIFATVAAVSVIGVVTLAYAQSTGYPASSPSTGMQQPMSPNAPNGPSTSTMPANPTGTLDGSGSNTGRTGPSNSGTTLTTDGNGMSTEREARADRN